MKMMRTLLLTVVLSLSLFVFAESKAYGHNGHGGEGNPPPNGGEGGGLNWANDPCTVVGSLPHWEQWTPDSGPLGVEELCLSHGGCCFCPDNGDNHFQTGQPITDKCVTEQHAPQLNRACVCTPADSTSKTKKEKGQHRNTPGNTPESDGQTTTASAFKVTFPSTLDAEAQKLAVFWRNAGAHHNHMIVTRKHGQNLGSLKIDRAFGDGHVKVGGHPVPGDEIEVAVCNGDACDVIGTTFVDGCAKKDVSRLSTILKNLKMLKPFVEAWKNDPEHHEINADARDHIKAIEGEFKKFTDKCKIASGSIHFDRESGKFDNKLTRRGRVAEAIAVPAISVIKDIVELLKSESDDASSDSSSHGAVSRGGSSGGDDSEMETVLAMVQEYMHATAHLETQGFWGSVLRITTTVACTTVTILTAGAAAPITVPLAIGVNVGTRVAERDERGAAINGGVGIGMALVEAGLDAVAPGVGTAVGVANSAISVTTDAAAMVEERRRNGGRHHREETDDEGETFDETRKQLVGLRRQ